MFKLKPLNKKGFGHVEMIVFAVVILAIGTIGYFTLTSSSAKRAGPTPVPAPSMPLVTDSDGFQGYLSPVIGTPTATTSTSRPNCYVGVRSPKTQQVTEITWGYSRGGVQLPTTNVKFKFTVGSEVTKVTVYWLGYSNKIEKKTFTGPFNDTKVAYYIYPEIRSADTYEHQIYGRIKDRPIALVGECRPINGKGMIPMYSATWAQPITKL